MKRIYLMRHGKAEDGDNMPDFERELLSKGRKKTEKVAVFLKDKEARPQQVLVSMARRTRQTAEIIVKTLSLSQSVVSELKDLYLASSNSILYIMYTLDDQIDELMIVGHNPGISSLATYLSDTNIDWMSTSAVIAVDIDIEKWTELSLGKKKLLYYTKASHL